MKILVKPEIYFQFKDKILELSLAVQKYDGERYNPVPLSDKEIAELIGLTPKEVTEIRCIAETEILDTKVWEEAEQFKKNRAHRQTIE